MALAQEHASCGSCSQMQARQQAQELPVRLLVGLWMFSLWLDEHDLLAGEMVRVACCRVWEGW